MLHLHWRAFGIETRQSLQTRSWHSSQRSPRSKISPKLLRQRAHSRSPSSCCRQDPFRLISSNSFFSFLRERKEEGALRKLSEMNSLKGDAEVLTLSSSPHASSISHLSAAPSGSCLSHVPADRRGSDPPRPAPLVFQSTRCRWNQPSKDVALRRFRENYIMLENVFSNFRLEIGSLAWSELCPSSVSVWSPLVFCFFRLTRGDPSQEAYMTTDTRKKLVKLGWHY